MPHRSFLKFCEPFLHFRNEFVHHSSLTWMLNVRNISTLPKGPVCFTAPPLLSPSSPSASSSFPPCQSIFVKPNPVHPTQWLLCIPEPPTSNYVQLIDSSTSSDIVLDRLKQRFPKIRFSIGFSDQPFPFSNTNTNTSFLDCLKNNLVIWIDQVPHVIVSDQLSPDFSPSSLPHLSKHHQYNLLDDWVSKKSKRYMYAGASFMITQLSAMIYLTYELGWDVMEPVSYLVGLGTTILGASYYAFYRREYTYEDAFQRLESKMKKSFQRKLSLTPTK